MANARDEFDSDSDSDDEPVIVESNSTGVTDADGRLSPNTMFDYEFYCINKAIKEAKIEYTVQLFHDGGKAQDKCYAAEFKTNAQSIILLNPASDEDETKSENKNEGTTPLPKTLAWIAQIERNKKNTTFIIPLSECRIPWYSLFSNRRTHWTKLVIQDDKCYFYDPKGFFSRAYSLNAVQDYLKKENYRSQKTTYTGLQPIFNESDCGLYNGWLAKEIVSQILRGSLLENVTISNHPDITVLHPELSSEPWKNTYQSRNLNIEKTRSIETEGNGVVAEVRDVFGYDDGFGFVGDELVEDRNEEKNATVAESTSASESKKSTFTGAVLFSVIVDFDQSQEPDDEEEVAAEKEEKNPLLGRQVAQPEPVVPVSQPSLWSHIKGLSLGGLVGGLLTGLITALACFFVPPLVFAAPYFPEIIAGGAALGTMIGAGIGYKMVDSSSAEKAKVKVNVIQPQHPGSDEYNEVHGPVNSGTTSTAKLHGIFAGWQPYNGLIEEKNQQKQNSLPSGEANSDLGDDNSRTPSSLGLRHRGQH